VNQEPDINFEPLPGYRLIERLGSGGYGEVWRAEAPGGLTKAIKFVFGKHDEKRASIELRALDHVRGVRHPFLLSLERIEVVDGRLLVVTEMADASVKDRFDICRRDGLRGIPRDELIGYMRDTADALDFMSETHALQHLDIKPENLLLLAGHVKVADFGLVKNMRQSQASLVGGMTPLYAAPEVFRGTPSRYSDQYSLAIVYQEMLTGTIPFAGCNSAELTLQHLNDEPDMSALALGDRYAVSRALSKDPQHRYASCREFVETLAKASASAMQAQSEPQNGGLGETPQYIDDSSAQAIKTEFCDENESGNWNAPSQLVADLPLSDCRILDLPSVDLAGRDARLAPTLILGIGGTAARVLSQLRRSIHNQFSGSRLPAVQFLLLDTDSRALSSATQDNATGLTPDEVLHLALRRPQHYRDNSQQLLHWLSRRWLYNIPRSLRTEGLRPLGRLALADHARQVGQRIRRAMSQALDSESIATSSAATGQEFRKSALRVVVVASISGGTGGGMALDIGYAVRTILQKLGISESRILGLITHSTDREAHHSELARVNAYSWLSEFNHFQQQGNAYPGDASCGLPAHQPGVTAFDQTYLLHLGENLDDVEFEQATQAIADYLHLDTLSSAGAFFDACRDAPFQVNEMSHPSWTTNLRSFGLSRRTAASNEFCDNFAGTITQHVLSSWLGARQKRQSDLVAATAGATADSGCVQLVRRLQLDTAGVVANVRALVEFQLDASATNFLSGWLKELGTAAEDYAQFRAIDQMFSARYEGAVDGELSMLGKPASAIVEPLVEKLRAELRRWVTRRLDEPTHRVAGTRADLQWVSQHFCESLADLQLRQNELAARLSQLNNCTNTPAAARSGATSSIANEYLAVSLDRLAASAARQVISALLSDAKAMSDEITALCREIKQIATTVSRSMNSIGAARSDDVQSHRSPSEAQLAAEITGKLPEIAAQVDARLQAEFLDPIGGFVKTIMEGGRPRAQLTAKLHELSRQVVHQAVARVNVLETIAGGPSHSPADDLKSSFALATPALLEFGGRRRTLVVLPREAAQTGAQSVVSPRLATAVTTIIGTDSSFTLVVEAEGLSLPHIALELVERRRDRVEFAGRVHCRTDIAWTPLVSSGSPADSTISTADIASCGEPEQAMNKTVVL
jgi:eukaryotic-like serine/threonine-protein kinase